MSQALSAVHGISTLDAFVKVTSTSLTLAPNTPFSTYEYIFELLNTSLDGHRWQIGDLVNQGEDIYGSDMSQILSDHQASTVMQWARICQAIPTELRYDAIPWTYYRDAYAVVDIISLASMCARCIDEFWDYRRWSEEISLHRKQVPQVGPGRPRRDVPAAISYAVSRQGMIWTADDVAKLREYLGDR